MLFTPYKIGSMNIPNRFVCSSTSDSELSVGGQVQSETIDKYVTLAREHVGMILTGGLPAVGMTIIEQNAYDYALIRIYGLDKIASAVHGVGNDCKIVAQLSTEPMYFIPSHFDSPWGMEGMHVCTHNDIRLIEESFIETALKMEEEGFDGVQLHGAHGGLISHFISPYANHRTDDYGGNTVNRCRLVTNIIRGIKKQSPSFPVLIKMNVTEYFEDGMNQASLQESVLQLEEAGIDGIEFSGGLWEAMKFSEDELGFPVVPTIEAHTRIQSLDKQSYYKDYIEDLTINVPAILVGGNRNCQLMEDLLQRNIAQFMSLCRPLICEPDLITQWQTDASYVPKCISCNACIYDLHMQDGSEEPRKTDCLFWLQGTSEVMSQRYKDGIAWIKDWKNENI